ncbi:N-acetylmuramic acid 6-phosphate etherase [Meridianimarinicoccus sp. MJW13]|uniref:N-acetylmuramic acid 6-phosphate etherase n=1 Tax=Meridianimarinicoccus sp. MJW13 TaxID=2720031 RepID=UPI001D02EFE0|nr:N-acetylmuramic acid 6-phosphate etherase [Fluviibacterium sp. MJW13]
MRTTPPTASGTMPLDALSRGDALSAMLASQQAAVAAVAHAKPAIDIAAVHLAGALSGGHRVFWAAAGSSGLMALADASEMPGTFGVAQDQIRICMAGGVPADGAMPGDTEDGTADALAAVATMQPGDLAIVVSASGTTPFAIAFAEAALKRGQTVVAIANVPGSRLLTLADVAIALPTGPEIIEGSTRLGAGTAQKVALNMMSTQAGVLMGHVHDGLMVNLIPDNIKLRKRAATIVSRITGVSPEAAQEALKACDWNTKCAVLVASGHDPDTARRMLADAGGRLRACLTAAAQTP